MRVTTIRHGQTDWNIARRIQGSVDIPLNRAGLEQAQRLAVRLAAEPCDIIYTSDLLRAKKTAEIINSRHGVELIATPILRETKFGDFEGRIIEEVGEDFGKHMDIQAPLYFAQIHAYLDEILQKGHENIFIVGHFGSVRAAICYFLKIPAERRGLHSVGNTAIHTFEQWDDGRFFMSLENDTAHLL